VTSITIPVSFARFQNLENLQTDLIFLNDSSYWRRRLFGPHPPDTASIISGKREVQRRILSIVRTLNPQTALGRALSEAEVVKTDKCIVIQLGELLHLREIELPVRPRNGTDPTLPNQLKLFL